jgi:hypothetical protein
VMHCRLETLLTVEFMRRRETMALVRVVGGGWVSGAVVLVSWGEVVSGLLLLFLLLVESGGVSSSVESFDFPRGESGAG